MFLVTFWLYKRSHSQSSSTLAYSSCFKLCGKLQLHEQLGHFTLQLNAAMVVSVRTLGGHGLVGCCVRGCIPIV